MPWTPAQIRLFRAAAHNPEIAASHGLSQSKAREMSMEGVRSPDAAQEARKKHLVKKLREG